MACVALFLAKKVLGIYVETLNRKCCQLAWKLMEIWKQKRQSTISFIFDSDKYSFVGGLHLEAA